MFPVMRSVVVLDAIAFCMALSMTKQKMVSNASCDQAEDENKTGTASLTSSRKRSEFGRLSCHTSKHTLSEVLISGHSKSFTLNFSGLANSFPMSTRAPANLRHQSRFENCALVGSSASLEGQRLGSSIDAHFPIIRVNRMPTSDYADDFGCRTDILYMNGWESRSHRITLMGSAKSWCKDKSHPYCYRSIDCSKGGPGCPLLSVNDNCRDIKRNWKSSTAPVGCYHTNITRVINEVTKKLAPSQGFLSSGLRAFLGFAPLCNRLTLYGFKGASMADGHDMDPRHNFTAEHAFYDRVKAGHLTEQDWGDSMSFALGEFQNTVVEIA
eukprot:gnl/TRDRNA2_/TRDRNA2_39421_c0_seq1.p1 gnl/TRDRNA2_/TRDRNA2_39421_c0~~gnl/TRDRNA2_/TRDRNA2_39421_c0_seq1.p1  ORF type:complete len:326 (+),score=10.84 gnl/TRDRNA2_/TRDRNA2_39421_c0_seq1:79-1056(+)